MAKRKTKEKVVSGTKGLKIKLLGDRVLVREEKKGERKTASGIIIPETVGGDSWVKKGQVVAVGPGKHDDGIFVPTVVKVGDKVSYQGGEKRTIDGNEYDVLSVRDVEWINQ